MTAARARRADDAWHVAVRWLPWRPRWRRSARWWVDDAMAPAEALPGWALWVQEVTFVTFAIGVVILILGLVLTVAAWLAALGGLAGAILGRLVLRHPFLVEARSGTAGWAGWWVVGWRRARAVRREVEAALRNGAEPSTVVPHAAVPHPAPDPS